MAKPKPLTKADVSEFVARLGVTIDYAERGYRLEGMLEEFVPRNGARAARNGVAKPAKGTRRRRRANPALEAKIIELVKGSKNGLGSIELTEKTSAPKERVKAIAHKLKAKGVFKVVGEKRAAKYHFVAKA